ncbi:patatin-like phospholipase family protein [Angustibacter speluncae]
MTTTPFGTTLLVRPDGTIPFLPGPPRDRALVLGGGGSAGNAWEIGLLAGLLAAGVDVTRPDLTVGTSAGATVAAQLADAGPAELLDAVLTTVPPARTDRPATRPTGSGGSVTDHLDRFRRIIAKSADAAEMRSRTGVLALEARDHTDRWRATVAARFTARHWPERLVLLTAVDATTGTPVVLDRDSGVDLVDAVAASTSGGGSAFRTGGLALVDGGYRRNENADLAAGSARVLVLSPLGGRSLHPPAWGMDLDRQVEELRAGGADVRTVVPDETSLAAMGTNLMDVSTRPAVARAAAKQGRAEAWRLTAWWRGEGAQVLGE